MQLQLVTLEAGSRPILGRWRLRWGAMVTLVLLAGLLGPGGAAEARERVPGGPRPETLVLPPLSGPQIKRLLSLESGADPGSGSSAGPAANAGEFMLRGARIDRDVIRVIYMDRGGDRRFEIALVHRHRAPAAAYVSRKFAVLLEVPSARTPEAERLLAAVVARLRREEHVVRWVEARSTLPPSEGAAAAPPRADHPGKVGLTRGWSLGLLATLLLGAVLLLFAFVTRGGRRSASAPAAPLAATVAQARWDRLAGPALALWLTVVEAVRLWPLLGRTCTGNGDRAQMASEAWYRWIPGLVITPGRDLFHPPITYLLGRLGMACEVSDAGLQFASWAFAVVAPGAVVLLLGRRLGLLPACLTAAWLARHPLLLESARTFSSLSLSIVAGLCAWTYFAPWGIDGGARGGTAAPRAVAPESGPGDPARGPAPWAFRWRDLVLFWVVFNATVLSWWIAATLLTWVLIVRRWPLGADRPLGVEVSRPLLIAMGAVLVRILLGLGKVLGGVADAAAVEAGSPLGWRYEAGLSIFQHLATGWLDTAVCAVALVGVGGLLSHRRREGVFWVIGLLGMAAALFAYSYTHRVKPYYASLLLPAVVIGATLGLWWVGQAVRRHLPGAWRERVPGRGWPARWVSLILAAGLVVAVDRCPLGMPRGDEALPSLAQLGHRPGEPFRLVTCDAEGVLPSAWLLTKRTRDLGYLRACAKAERRGEARLRCRHREASLLGMFYPRDLRTGWELGLVARLKREAGQPFSVVCPIASPQGPLRRYLKGRCSALSEARWAIWRCGGRRG